jgi:hypothetical protein
MRRKKTVVSMAVGVLALVLLGCPNPVGNGEEAADRLVVTVSFDGNGATEGLPPEPISTQAGSDVEIPDSDTLMRTQEIDAQTGALSELSVPAITYAFSGWNTAADGSGETHVPGSTIVIDADLRLYALWQIDDTEEAGDQQPDSAENDAEAVEETPEQDGDTPDSGGTSPDPAPEAPSAVDETPSTGGGSAPRPAAPSPGTGDETPPTTGDEEPPVVDGAPPVVENEPPVVEEESPVTEEPPEVGEEEPPVTEEPPVVDDEPPATSGETGETGEIVESPPATGEEPPATGGETGEIVETPPALDETEPDVLTVSGNKINALDWFLDPPTFEVTYAMAEDAVMGWEIPGLVEGTDYEIDNSQPGFVLNGTSYRVSRLVVGDRDTLRDMDFYDAGGDVYNVPVTFAITEKDDTVSTWSRTFTVVANRAPNINEFADPDGIEVFTRDTPSGLTLTLYVWDYETRGENMTVEVTSSSAKIFTGSGYVNTSTIPHFANVADVRIAPVQASRRELVLAPATFDPVTTTLTVTVTDGDGESTTVYRTLTID